jgi:hypothetical protein
MPDFLEKKLKAEAAKKGFTGRKADRYVFGAMNNMGAMRGNQETAKGAAMQKKHESETHGFTGSVASYKHSRPRRKIQKRTF